eukprot:4994102-Pleurochrysis_carterae.AAC.1
MGCEGRLHLALAEAVGRPAHVASLFAAGSVFAVEGAVEDWNVLLARVGGADKLWAGQEPSGWGAAARRLGD